MKAQLQQYLDRIDARTLRERLLIFAMAVVVVVTLIQSLLLDPLLARRKHLDQEFSEQQARLSAAQAQVQTLAAARSVDPDAANRTQLAALKEKIAQADARLESFQKGLVSSAHMAEMLRDILSRNGGLKLVSMRTLPVSALSQDASKSAEGGKGEAGPADAADINGAIYRHGIEVTVEGDFNALLAYATELEKLHWQVYWGGAVLAVREYPVSRLTLTLYTLSLEKTWLSV